MYFSKMSNIFSSVTDSQSSCILLILKYLESIGTTSTHSDIAKLSDKLQLTKNIGFTHQAYKILSVLRLYICYRIKKCAFEEHNYVNILIEDNPALVLF